MKYRPCPLWTFSGVRSVRAEDQRGVIRQKILENLISGTIVQTSSQSWQASPSGRSTVLGLVRSVENIRGHARLLILCHQSARDPLTASLPGQGDTWPQTHETGIFERVVSVLRRLLVFPVMSSHVRDSTKQIRGYKNISLHPDVSKPGQSQSTIIKKEKTNLKLIGDNWEWWETEL